MSTTVPLHNHLLKGAQDANGIAQALAAFYTGSTFVRVVKENPPMLAANHLAGTNSLELSVYGNGEQTVITALFDNLGKGASGAAVQNMNICLGLDESTGLI